MNLLILAAYGRMARIVEDRILSEPDFKEVTLTLGRRKSDRLLRESGLDYTTLRLCRLTDRDEVDMSPQGGMRPSRGYQDPGRAQPT